ncbi:MAG: D-alanyl-D-alanine carboxypeptidase [Candidatus Omnitrophica bacterium]|nr:D-alanyl-D-alanine carboxypeptidase [Candidatus Omnitrophota bacterium]
MTEFKQIKKVVLFSLVSVLLLCPRLSAVQEGLTAKSAIIMDASNGKVLYQRNSNVRMPAASTVKVLTAIMSVSNLDLNSYLTVSKRAAGIAPSKVYLTEKAEYKVIDLIKCLLMSSANDAGVVLAEAMAQTEFQFSLKMNEQARQLGAKDSFFLNATGLPEYKKKQYSTVYDLALFMKACMNNRQLVSIMQTKMTEVEGSDKKVISIKNHNKFLWRNSNDLIGKTGYTRQAGHCFLGSFSSGKRKLIVAIQGSRKPWDDLNYLINKKY